MTQDATTGDFRPLTDAEFGLIAKTFREGLGWSQEVLSSVSGLSVRTIQRVESGEPAARDTRRAIARAFELDDIDVFSKPMDMAAGRKLAEEQKRLAEDCDTLEAVPVTTGKQLGRLVEASFGFLVSENGELPSATDAPMAFLTDYIRDYQDGASDLPATTKLEVYAELNDALREVLATGVEIVAAHQRTAILGASWPDQTPLPVTFLYLVVSGAGSAPKTIMVAKKQNVRFL